MKITIHGGEAGNPTHVGEGGVGLDEVASGDGGKSGDPIRMVRAPQLRTLTFPDIIV